MKNITNLIFLLTLLISSFSSAQNTNLLLLQNIEDRVNELKPKLDLTESEVYQLTSILTKSTSKLANLNVFSDNLKAERDAIISRRDLAINKV